MNGFVIKHESGKFHATCGLTEFANRAYFFAEKEDAEREITWNIQHPSEDFPPGKYEIVTTERE